MSEAFDLIVIGSGAGASAAAYKCRKTGWRVAVIDAAPFGGTCALRGCDPKKVLLGAADLVDWSRRMADRGVSPPARIDWRALMRFKRSFTTPVPERQEQSLHEAGIETFHGRVRFADSNTLLLGDRRLTARFFLLATGARPASLRIEGEHYLTLSDQFLELDELPPRILFVGGGYISFEFAFLAAIAGAQVAVVHRGERVLTRFDPDLVGILLDKAHSLGIVVHPQTELVSIERTPDGLIAHARARCETRFAADMIVHGAGRVPDLDDLDLGRGNVERVERGVRVNDYLQSVTNPNVYAAGDAAATVGLPLTPIAAMESHVAGSNMLRGNQVRPDYRAIPTVAFTVPPLASVGLPERDAPSDIQRRFETTARWYASRRVAEAHTAFKVLTDKPSGKVLGAHLLGPQADETVNLFALAIRNGLTDTDLKRAIYAYPTQASDIAYMM